MYEFTWQLWSNKPANKKLISENMEKAKKEYAREKFIWEQQAIHIQNQYTPVINK